ncbi:tyrosine-type recombinase/integrase [Luteimonas qiangzhengi]|uniref:tyrosine-type recombinase/integrase n=1 Tax=Luteimonas sp. MJ146 TaxID=3129240 RepID=UPI0031BB3870
MPLTATAIRNSRAGPKPQRLPDGGGLYLLIPAAKGAPAPAPAAVSRWWRLDYRRPVTGTRNTLSLGTYPDVSLADARRKREEARKLLAEGVDPGAARKTGKAEAVTAAANTFGAVAAEWAEMQRKKYAPRTYIKSQWLLQQAADLDATPIREITPPLVLAVLRKIEAKGHHETAHRVKTKVGQVIRYAIATGRADRDPTADLRGALAPVVTTSHAAVTDPADVADLLRGIDGYVGQPTTQAALKLAPLLFLRPGELRGMEWGELDLDSDAPTLRIRGERMKMKEGHVVPLSRQAVAILRELHAVTGSGTYVFPSLQSRQSYMSENTINTALRRMGYDNKTMTGHGFRAMASTRLNEMGYAVDVIERQLAHAERNKVRAAYNRAQYMVERRKMMQEWADYLDALKAGVKAAA